ncbi:MAG TPA: urease accessory protein UreD [Verrucomicrobiae bacterium]|jgi:urease accessory protein|nr:urease accessory protein UreD [Verrucomicrobiae bacterium]
MNAAPPGSAGVNVRLVAGKSAITRLWCSNPVKILTPRPRGPSVWAYLSSFGGGFVAGDETRLEVEIGPRARCFITTQASTKVYRNPDSRPCGHCLDARVGEGALLVLAPDPVQSFAGSTYRQTQNFHLAPASGLILLDWFSSGRAACGERWGFHRLSSRNDIFIGGERVILDAMLLDHAHGPLGSQHRLGRFNTVALMVLAGELLHGEIKTTLDRVAAQPAARRSRLIFSASPVREGLVLRVAGESQEEVAHYVYDTLRFAGAWLGDDPWARKLN